MPTADPIASIPYPVLTAEADIANTMQPAIDAIGVALGDIWTANLSVTSLITVIPVGTSYFTTTIRAWRSGKVVTVQGIVNGTPYFTAWQVDQIASIPAGLRPAIAAAAVLSYPALTGNFSVTVTPAGAMNIVSDGAVTFPSGDFSFTAVWVLA